MFNVTLLAAANKDNKPDVQLIDDTVNPKTDDGLGKLVIRNFLHPGASVTAGVGAQPSWHPADVRGNGDLGKPPSAWFGCEHPRHGIGTDA